MARYTTTTMILGILLISVLYGAQIIRIRLADIGMKDTYVGSFLSKVMEFNFSLCCSGEAEVIFFLRAKVYDAIIAKIRINGKEFRVTPNKNTSLTVSLMKNNTLTLIIINPTQYGVWIFANSTMTIRFEETTPETNYELLIPFLLSIFIPPIIIGYLTRKNKRNSTTEDSEYILVAS